jgi:hypothetical protein
VRISIHVRVLDLIHDLDAKSFSGLNRFLH